MTEIRTDESLDASQDLTTRGTPRKRKRRTTVDVPVSREAGEVPVGVEAMAKVFSHPLRVKILYAMNGPERERSASELGELLGVDLKRISYHMRELEAIGFIQVVDERPVRGAVEKIYAPVKRLEAWDVEWSQLPEVAKQLLAANTLGLAVRALGASIDSGDFGKHDDSVLSQSTIWTDERGAMEALGALFQAAEKLVAIEAESKARLKDSEQEPLALSYLIGGYEGGLRPVE